MGSGAVIIRTKFQKDWFRYSKVNRGDSGGLGLKILVARRQRGPTHNYKAII
jgi:hypothetical protein